MLLCIADIQPMAKEEEISSSLFKAKSSDEGLETGKHDKASGRDCKWPDFQIAIRL